VLNFQMAAELAGDEGLHVEAVLVNDDVAVENSTWTAGRRGTGATVFVEKIVGAAGKPGFELGEDEIELGVGIHGEPGRARGRLVPATQIAEVALAAIHAD